MRDTIAGIAFVLGIIVLFIVALVAIALGGAA